MKKCKLSEKLSSFFLAIIICANSISWGLKMIPNVLVFILLVGIGVITIVNKDRIFHCLNKNQIRFLIILLVVLGYSFIIASINGGVDCLLWKIVLFGCFGLGLFFIANVSYRFDLLVRYIITISLLMLPIVYSIDLGVEGVDSIDYGKWMGVSYGILPYMNASIYFLMFKDIRKYVILPIISIVGYLPFFIFYGSRGAIVSFLVTIIVCYFLKKQYNLKKMIKHFFRSALIILVIIIPFFYLIRSILEFIVDEYNIFFLRKLIQPDAEAGITNGRLDLYMTAFDGFLHNPIWGNGIASFDGYSGAYPHNFLLQILFEGGIILFIPVIVILYRSLKSIFSYSTSFVDFRLISFLFFTSVINLFFSSDFWGAQLFWLLVWLSFYIKKTKYENCNCSSSSISKETACH